MSIVFDKLAMVKRLEQQDAFTRPQAETLADALHVAMSEDMVSKADLKATDDALRTDMTGLRSELRATEASLKAEMRVLEHSLKLWAGTLVVGQFAAIIGVMAFLPRFFH